MNNKDMELCQHAAQLLKLRDIVLFGSRFNRGDAQSAEGVQQHKKEVRYQRATIVENEEQKNLLQIIVLLGTRVVDKENAEDVENAALHFQIEADYLIDYQLSGELSEEAANAFASFNAVHNVWPFWRQHVYDIVQRGRLPHLDIPLYQGKP